MSGSSDDEELTCLLDLVDGGQKTRKTTFVVKEEIVEEDILQLRNVVQQIHMKEVSMDKLGDRVSRDDHDQEKEINLNDQVELLKKEICALLVEREKLNVDSFKVRVGGREAELRADLIEIRRKVANAKAAKEQLTELYRERNSSREERGMVVASMEEFSNMKEEYFR